MKRWGASGTESASRAFEALYRRHWAPMVRLAWLLAGSRQVAEDVVHDAFLRLEARVPAPDFPDVYLRRMVVNGVHDHHRRVAVERRHQPPSPEPGPDPGTNAAELWSLVRQLPPRQREAVVLRYYADLSFGELAALMDCPVATARTLVHRGLARLRKEATP